MTNKKIDSSLEYDNRKSTIGNRPRVTVVIPTYNGASVVVRCIESVRQHRDVEEVIVVDNNSTDDTVELAYQHGATIRRSPINVGFGAACDIGIAQARSQLILLLNQDAAYVQGLSSAIDTITNTASVSCVGGLMYSSAGELRPSIMRYPRLRSVVMKRMSYTGDEEKLIRRSFPAVEPVDYFEFSLALLDKQKYLDCGGFDTRYFMYGEERDLVYRMSASGDLCVVNRDLHYIHDGGYSAQRELLVIKGLVTFLNDHVKPHKRRLLKLVVVAKCTFKLAKAKIFDQSRPAYNLRDVYELTVRR